MCVNICFNACVVWRDSYETEVLDIGGGGGRGDTMIRFVTQEWGENENVKFRYIGGRGVKMTDISAT